MIDALDLHITGTVQGVGFRPFVYRLAKRHLLNGWVLNAADGVHVHVEGESPLVDAFVLALKDEVPAAARVRQIDIAEVPLQDCVGFEIRGSEAQDVEEMTTVPPDLALCADCAAELFDPQNRRYRYPFINCTNCGPRFTIIDALPYDRASTSMAGFALCPACAAEYADPADRRFHAQPDACFACGPGLSFVPLPAERPFEELHYAATRAESDAVLAAAVALLRAGGIVAVKGLGGFHLACDANNAQAVATLRRRKRREGKPFAVMCAQLEDVRRVCCVSDEEAAVLTGAQRPIVLLRKRPDARFAPQLADDLPELGVMLPYTPLQALLLHDFAQACVADGAGAGAGDAGGEGTSEGASGENPPMLVMTSANVHDEPIVIDDAEALQALAGIADALVGNNRPIRARYDDSVVRLIAAGSAGAALQVVRRARGLCPVPLDLPSAAECCVLATGPEQKSTVTFAHAGKAYVSQHVGDLENAATFDAWLEAQAFHERLFHLRPDRLACDAHPEYLSSKWAAQQAAAAGLPLSTVQHHHAHVAAVMGEHGLEGPVCGFAFDGTGFGADGCVWGGEVLLANTRDYERFANFAYVPLPGGAAAVKHPLRMAYGVLWAFDLLEHPAAAPVLEALGPVAELCARMIERGLNVPYTSSVGRLFDAASALLGLCTTPTYESEAATLLGAAAPQLAFDEHYRMSLSKNTATAASTAHDTSVLLIDAAPSFSALLDDMAAGVAVPLIAARFHGAFVQVIADVAQAVCALYGIETVVLSGGCFLNRLLVEGAIVALEAQGLRVAISRDLPPGDGAISFGQAVIACARANEATNEG